MASSSKNSNRLVALDILRGITIAGMLLVNNPGTWSAIYAPLDHAQWIGLTPTDLVFPFFMFCMGVAMFFSLRKFDFTMSGKLCAKIVRRTVLLILIGWAIHWFSHVLYGLAGGKPWGQLWNNLASMRILGVFQRLALCYFFVALIAVFVRHKFLPWLIGIILVAYALILGLGCGYDFSIHNIIARIDGAILGPEHMYHEAAYGTSIALDPEGILSTLPCIAHTLIGFLVGKMIIEHRDNGYRISRLLVIGAAFVLLGWLLHYGIPCSKKVWSSTYVLITTGMAMCVLALLIYFVDVKGHHRWSRFFQTFGVNPLSLYVLGSILSIIFGAVTIGHSADYVAPNPDEAGAMLAKLDLPQAKNNLGVAAYDDSKSQAAQLFAQAAAADSSLTEARYNLAVTYLEDADATNDAQVPALLTAAADSGNVNAQFNLALLYDYGKCGLQADHARAANLYGQAAGAGLDRALSVTQRIQGDSVGITRVNEFSDLLITDLATCGPIEADSLSAAEKTYNQALQVADGQGKRYTIHSAIFNFCKAVTTSTEAASCLYAILFIFINWIFGFILYKKNIIIKL